MKKIICKLHIDNLSKHRKEGRKKEIRKEEMKEGRKEIKKEGRKKRKERRKSLLNRRATANKSKKDYRIR